MLCDRAVKQLATRPLNDCRDCTRQCKLHFVTLLREVDIVRSMEHKTFQHEIDSLQASKEAAESKAQVLLSELKASREKMKQEIQNLRHDYMESYERVTSDDRWQSSCTSATFDM